MLHSTSKKKEEMWAWCGVGSHLSLAGCEPLWADRACKPGPAGQKPPAQLLHEGLQAGLEQRIRLCQGNKALLSQHGYWMGMSRDDYRLLWDPERLSPLHTPASCLTGQCCPMALSGHAGAQGRVSSCSAPAWSQGAALTRSFFIRHPPRLVMQGTEAGLEAAQLWAVLAHNIAHWEVCLRPRADHCSGQP